MSQLGTFNLKPFSIFNFIPAFESTTVVVRKKLHHQIIANTGATFFLGFSHDALSLGWHLRTNTKPEI